MIIGIYIIRGPKDRVYVGQSINIPARWRYHRKALRANRHENSKLQNAWNKYGESRFQFSVFIVCAACDLVTEEQKAMDAFDSVRVGYNIAPAAGSNLGMKAPWTSKRNKRLRGKLHPSFGKKRPDLALRNRLYPPLRGKKAPWTARRMRGVRGAKHPLFGRKFPARQGPRGPFKLKAHALEINRRLLAGETISSLAREYNVKWDTIKKIKVWHGWVTRGDAA